MGHCNESAQASLKLLLMPDSPLNSGQIDFGHIYCSLSIQLAESRAQISQTGFKIAAEEETPGDLAQTSSCPATIQLFVCKKQ